MKVLAVRGSNITSLESFTLDFSAPSFTRGGGLFVITGPTGAGKSTLLDCICLALYGSTPRYDNKQSHQIGSPQDGKRIKASDPRNLLRHGAGSGFAEVDFLGVDGRVYRSRWCVRRARNKPTGNILNPEWVIQELDSEGNPINEYSSKGVTENKAFLLKKVGLTLKQFGRSVFLAQGEFDAFLKADSKERGELLEKMTGTEIYRKLSARAFAKCKEVKLHLEELNERRAKLKLLTRAEEGELKRQFKEYEHNFERSNEALDQTTSQLQSLEIYSDRERTLASLEHKLEHFQKTISAHQEKLSIAQRHLALSPLIPILMVAQDSQGKALQTEAKLEPIRLRYDESEHKLTGLSESTKEQRASVERLGQRWFEGEDERIKLAQVDEGVRRAQLEVEKAEEALSRQGEVSQSAARRCERAAQQLEELTEELTQLEGTHLALARFQLPESQSSSLRQAGQKLSALIAQLTQVDAELELLDDRAHRAQLSNEPLHQQIEKNEEELAGRYAELDALGEVSEERLERLSAAQQELVSVHFMLDKAKEQWRHWSAERLRLEQVETEEQGIEASLSQMDEGLKALQKEAWLTEHKLEEAQTAWDAHQALNQLAPLREELREGEPCPLCGALEHPLGFESTSADLEQLSATLGRCKVAHDSSLERLTEHERERLKTEESLRYARARSREVSVVLAQHFERSLQSVIELSRAEREALTRCAKGGASTELSELIQALRALQERSEPTQWARMNERLEGLLKSAKLAEDQLDQDRRALLVSSEAQATLRAQIEELERALHIAQGGLKHSAQELEKTLEDRARVADGQAELLAQLEEHRGALYSPAERLLDAASELRQTTIPPRLIQESLEVARWICSDSVAREGLSSPHSVLSIVELWEQLFDERLRLKRRCDALQGDQERRSLELKQLRQEAQREEQELAHRAESFEQLKATAQEALSLQEESAAKRAQIEALKEQLQVERAKLEHLQRDHQSAERALTDARGELEQAKLELSEVKAKASEAKRLWEEHARRARTTEDEVLTLTDEQLHDAHFVVKLNGEHIRQRDLTEQQLEGYRLELAELARALPEGFTERRDLFTTELRQQRAAQQHQRDELFALRTEVQRKLSDHEQQQKQQQSFEAELSRVSREYDRWSILNELIGSQKGDKFRDFAQSLTLEMILDHSNVFLRDLAPRYQLTRVADENLAFQIIDQDFGDELRSVYSLSGGESFLVSLALALGLSSTSAQDVQIQSLFIDEGFGTLDPASLDMALSVLENLQVEGRQIGIISHVDGLAERVGLEVKVSPQGGGRSVVQVQEFD